MTPQTALAELLERLGALEGELTYVTHDELAKWPTNVVVAFKTLQLLVAAPRASSVLCSGCYRRCSKEVDVFPEETGRPARAHIVCDEPEAMGVISVKLHSLQRWQTTGAALARALRRMLGFSKVSMQNDYGKTLQLGVLKGARFSGPVTLEMGDGVSLTVAGHSIPVAEILIFDGERFGVDTARLTGLVDQPLTTESPEQRAARIRESLKNEKASGNKRYLKTVAKREGVSETRIKQLRSSKPGTSGLSAPNTSRGSSKAKK